MPTLLSVHGGVSGALHTKDFRLDDPELAYVMPAKAIALTIVDLLVDGADKGHQIMKNFQPQMTKKQYFEFQKEMSREIQWHQE